jgi:hypothetical protein
MVERESNNVCRFGKVFLKSNTINPFEYINYSLHQFPLSILNRHGLTCSIFLLRRKTA